MRAPRKTRILSLIMTLVFCLYLVPVEVMATELKNVSNITQSEIVGETTMESADIISEIVSSRDKYQKEYILSNGLRMLNVYPTAVHYEDENGLWQEIDNTLRTTTEDGKRVYRNTAGLWDVTLPSSLSGNDAVSITRGNSTLSFHFAGQLVQDNVLTAQLAQMKDETAETVAPEESVPTVETPPAEENTTTEDTVPAEGAPSVESDTSSDESVSAENSAPLEETATPDNEIVIDTALAEEDSSLGNAANVADDTVLEDIPTPLSETAAETEETVVPDDVVESVTEDEPPESTDAAPNDTVTDSSEAAPTDDSADNNNTEATEEIPAVETEQVTPPTETAVDNVAADTMWETATTTRIGDAVFGRTQVQPAQISLKESTALFSKGDKLLKQSFSDKINSAAEYASVFNGVNVRYDLKSNSLKESVIISSVPAYRVGYQYLLKTENLVLQLQEDNSIYAYETGYSKNDEPLFYMPAPYLYDQDKAYCDDIDLTLAETAEGYVLTYLLPQEWMADKDRAYPVVLDPVVNAELSVTNIADQTVFSKTQLSYTWAMLCIGQGQYGIGRSFLKYKNLPTLTSADVVVEAKMALYKLQTSSTTSEIDVHKVNGTWESNTINWSNMPDYDSTVEDYQIAGAEGWYYWDITDIAQEWYTGDNTGMMFKMEDSQEAAATDLYREFCSSDYTVDTLPYLSIAYINNCGLENIWDYTAHSAGAAGTGYVNDYTGNLVWVYNGLGFPGNRMPVAINHIYNANDKSDNFFGMGYGWRTNYNQLVYQDEDSNYYVWEDEDATRHYFKYKSSGTYEDEVNTGLILTTTGSGTTKYCITDKNNNKSYFDTSGRLTKISNNQATKSNITITYSSGKYISMITDGAGRKYQFNYSGSTLNSISFLGTGSTALATESYSYSGSNLVGISSTMLSSATFSYTSNHLLSQAADANGYKLQYSYNVTNATQPNRIVQVKEYDGSTAGGTLNISYGHNQNTFTDHNGNKEIVQFNNFGSTVSVQDGEGKAQFYKYKSDSDIAKASQLAVSSKLQNTVINQISNSSFEQSGGWAADSSNATTGSWGYASTGYIGNKSLSITRTASSGNFAIRPDSNCVMEPGRTYTLSAYVKTTGMSGGGTGARLAISVSGTTVATSEAVSVTKDWTRLEATYTNPATAETTMALPCLQNGTTGTAYFDCVQFEESANASRYNLVEDGDFKYYGFWTKNSACDSSDNTSFISPGAVPQMQNYNYGYHLYGEASKNKEVSQTINVSGNTGDVFTLSGWAKGESAPISGDRKFALRVRFNNSSSGEAYVNFNPSATDWQYAAERIIAPRAYTSVTVSLVYHKNVNDVYFDAIQLFKEEFGHSYVYDSNGNVTSVTDLQKQTTTYQYSNNNLTKMTLPSGASQTYTYDSYHNVLSATSPEGVVSNFTYDTYGNNTKVTVGSGTKKITATATYTSNGDQLSTVTDALGQTTSYGYDTQTGVLNWTQAPGETTTTRTNYSHDSRYRTTAVSKGNSTVGYNYSSDLLSSITSASGTNYSFTYGVFDLVSSVKAGSRTLISHTYSNDSNRRLTRSDYGNGDFIAYTYDDLGRTTGISYENKTNAVGYTYDNNGNLGIMTDNIAGRKTKYFYDFQDRMMRYEETGSGYSNSVQWGYDDKNNLSSQTQTLNGSTYTTSYAYDDDNRLTQSTSGTKSANYTYDIYSRMTGITAKNGSSSVVNTNITYKDPSSSGTSTQIYQWTTGGVTYTYTYDNRGNITSVSDGTNTTSYVYDSLDQLTRENNQAANKTWVYTYDNGGNILSKKEYAYTTGALGTAVDTISYGYGDSTWKDLLTSYDGQSLTTDTIGNLTDDGKWDYTWQHGRQLTKMQDPINLEDAKMYGYEVSFEYNADGQRTAKTYEQTNIIVRPEGESTYVGGETTKYFYAGDTLTEVVIDNLAADITTRMSFTYDATGPMSVNYDGVEYFYLKNAQGDITGLVDSAGTKVVTYTYDAWGKLLSTTGTKAYGLGEDNPFRYRSYVYDQETGLYYLNSRYYNPTTGRFINADSYLATGQGVLGSAMFSYCNNNPVNARDDGGTFLCALIGAAVGAVFGYVTTRIDGGSHREALASAAKGAITGGAAGLVADVAMVTGGSALVIGLVTVAVGGVSNVAGTYVEKKINAKNKELTSPNNTVAQSSEVTYTRTEIIGDFIEGAVLSIPSAVTAGAQVPMMTDVMARAGKRTLAKGITYVDATLKTLRRELQQLGDTIGAEIIGNVGSWYAEKMGGIIIAQFDS